MVGRRGLFSSSLSTYPPPSWTLVGVTSSTSTSAISPRLVPLAVYWIPLARESAVRVVQRESGMGEGEGKQAIRVGLRWSSRGRLMVTTPFWMGSRLRWSTLWLGPWACR